MNTLIEEHARRTVELTDDHPLGSVDDERPPVRHERDVSEENILFDYFGDLILIIFFGDT